MKPLKILFVGHACSPDAGSEPGLTWNWAWHFARKHKVWVIAHPYTRATVERALSGHGAPGPRMVWVDVPAWRNPWKPDRGERGIHPHYMMWQRAAFRSAQRLHKEHRFDIVHHVSWGTVTAAPALWRLDAPFVWGPLGGGQASPLRFSRYLGLMGTISEVERNLRRSLAPFAPAIRRAASRSALVLATNRETADVLRRAGARHVEMFLDNGVLPDQFTDRSRHRKPGDRLDLIWAGRIEPRKGLPLALAAMARVTDCPVRLHVAGDGPQRAAAERLSAQLGLRDRVRFLGMAPRADLKTMFSSADALLFTSLQDGFGSVVLEALAAGLPVIGPDHQGVGAMIPDTAALKIAMRSPEQAIGDLAEAIRTLVAAPALGQRMSDAARQFALTERWDQRVMRMSELYQRCLECGHDHTWLSKDDCDGALLSQASP